VSETNDRFRRPDTRDRKRFFSDGERTEKWPFGLFAGIYRIPAKVSPVGTASGWIGGCLFEALRFRWRGVRRGGGGRREACRQV